jgi:hypothetical protein
MSGLVAAERTAVDCQRARSIIDASPIAAIAASSTIATVLCSCCWDTLRAHTATAPSSTGPSDIVTDAGIVEDQAGSGSIVNASTRPTISPIAAVASIVPIAIRTVAPIPAVAAAIRRHRRVCENKSAKVPDPAARLPIAAIRTIFVWRRTICSIRSTEGMPIPNHQVLE